MDGVAFEWAEEMDRRNVLMHRPTVAPYSAEVIASGTDDPHRALQLWFNSPPHREIVLSPNYDKLGVGYSGGYWIMVFN
jgi:uncharacterized protein YkwD